MNEIDRLAYITGIYLAVQFAWIFISVMIISKLIGYPESFYEYGIAPPINEYVFPMLRDCFIMFIPAWVYIGFCVYKLRRGEK